MSLPSLQLDAFHALAQIGHFTRAAERLHITQSALSQRILNLERDLETTLFVRDRQGVRLTPAGSELLRFCQAKEGLESEFLSQLRSGTSQNLAGQIRLGGYSSILHSLLIPALAPLLREHPKVRLCCLAREVYDLPRLLQQGEVDFIVLDHRWERGGVEAVLLGHEENVLVERKGYRGPEIYLDHDEKDDTTVKYFGRSKKKWSGQRHFLDDIYGLVEGVRQGLGRAVLPRHLIKGDSDFKVVDPSQVIRAPLYLHYFGQPFYSRLHTATVEALRLIP